MANWTSSGVLLLASYWSSVFWQLQLVKKNANMNEFALHRLVVYLVFVAFAFNLFREKEARRSGRVDCSPLLGSVLF